MDQETLVKTIKAGGIVVMPTDTIYGLLTSATNPSAIERLYQLRQRDHNKPFIILISALEDLKLFNVQPTPKQLEQLNQLWPGPVSEILCTRAFRLPAKAILRELISQTGPLVAPSANLAGQPPATTMAEAQAYFGNQIEGYVDGGHLEGEPSTLVSLAGDGNLTVLRGRLKH